MLLEELGQLKIPMTSSGIEPAPSDLQHSASTNYATACLTKFYSHTKIEAKIGFPKYFNFVTFPKYLAPSSVFCYGFVLHSGDGP
jgi:hypothetical protein